MRIVAMQHAVHTPYQFRNCIRREPIINQIKYQLNTTLYFQFSIYCDLLLSDAFECCHLVVQIQIPSRLPANYNIDLGLVCMHNCY